MPYFLVRRQWSRGGYNCLTCNRCCYLLPRHPCASDAFTVFLACTPQSLTSAMVNLSKPPHHVAERTPNHFLFRLPTVGTDLLLATNNVANRSLHYSFLELLSVPAFVSLIRKKDPSPPRTSPLHRLAKGRNSQQNYWLIHLFGFTILSREHGHQYQGRIKHKLMLRPERLAGSILTMIFFSHGPYSSSLPSS